MVRDAAQLAWIVNLGCIDLNPHPVRADDLDHPDELRVDLDPVPGVGWPQIRDVAMVTKEVLEDVRSGRMAEDLRIARDPRVRADRAPLDVPRGAARGARARPRGRAPRARPRHEPVVEGGTPRRVPRLQPEREGPHRRLRVLGPSDRRRAGLGAAAVGRGSRAASRTRSRSTPCRSGSPRSAIPPRASTRRPGRSTRSSSSRPSTRRRGSATRRGRRSTRSRKASRPACSPRSAGAGRRRSRASSRRRRPASGPARPGGGGPRRR